MLIHIEPSQVLAHCYAIQELILNRLFAGETLVSINEIIEFWNFFQCFELEIFHEGYHLFLLILISNVHIEQFSAIAHISFCYSKLISQKALPTFFYFLQFYFFNLLSFHLLILIVHLLLRKTLS